MLPHLHALSGCDTTSFLYNKGKRAFMSAITAMNVVPDLASVCKELEGSETIPENIISWAVQLTISSNLLLKDWRNYSSRVKTTIFLSMK